VKIFAGDSKKPLAWMCQGWNSREPAGSYSPVETTRINKEMLSRHLSNLQGSICYIAGPPSMVTAMRIMLVAFGVDEDDIRTEEFAGY
jgi:ferredoxin-NADP reductase